MSAVIAEGEDGEPGGLDAAETVLHGQANGVTQAARMTWGGRTCYMMLSLDGEPDIYGWDLPYWLDLRRKAGGH